MTRPPTARRRLPAAAAVTAEAPRSQLLASPCVGICELDPVTGLCVGCARDRDEIAAWRDLDPAHRERIWSELPRRRWPKPVVWRLLPWTARLALDRFAFLSRVPGARWSMGVWGAVAELARAPGERLQSRYTGDALILRTRGGRLRLEPHPGLRVFELDVGRDRAARLVLAVHRARLIPAPSVITELGPDRDALVASARDQLLFDLGVGAAFARFLVRTGDRTLIEVLRANRGRSLLGEPGLIADLVARSPDRVVVAPIGRIEIDSPIGQPGHAGPHTHLLPALLALRRDIDPGLDLPPDYAPCASFHPAEAAAESAFPAGATRRGRRSPSRPRPAAR